MGTSIPKEVELLYFHRLTSVCGAASAFPAVPAAPGPPFLLAVTEARFQTPPGQARPPSLCEEQLLGIFP